MTVTDDDGGSGAGGATVTVNNVNPVATISGAPAGTTEGSTIALIGSRTDQGTLDSHTFAWSVTRNGVTYPATGSTTSFSFVANDDGVYKVFLVVTDDDSGSHTTSVEITVTNVAPTIAPSGAATTPEGSIYSLNLGDVTDPGDDTVQSYTVHWGDGLQDTYPAAAVDGSSGVVTHEYDDGTVTRTITVDLVDEDGTFTGAGGTSVQVLNVAPTVTITGQVDGAEGSAITLGSTITDPSDADTAFGFAKAWSITKNGSPWGPTGTGATLQLHARRQRHLRRDA